MFCKDVVASETAVVYSYVRFWYGRFRSQWLRHCSAGNISSWFINSAHQWAINRNVIISSTSIDCHSLRLCYWTGTRAVFFTLIQVYWMICRWINVISNHWGCIGVYLWQLRQLQIRTNCRNTCRRCQTVSITDHVQFLSRLINLFMIWNKIIKNTNTQCI